MRKGVRSVSMIDVAERFACSSKLDCQQMFREGHGHRRAKNQWSDSQPEEQAGFAGQSRSFRSHLPAALDLRSHIFQTLAVHKAVAPSTSTNANDLSVIRPILPTINHIHSQHFIVLNEVTKAARTYRQLHDHERRKISSWGMEANLRVDPDTDLKLADLAYTLNT